MNQKVNELMDKFGVSHRVACEIVADAMNARLTERVRRVPTEVYSRVVGYFRPVSQWNEGKQSEFAERKEYRVNGGRFDPDFDGAESVPPTITPACR